MEDNPDFEAPSTREVGLLYGAILAVVSMLLFLIPAVMGENPFKSVWNWVGSAITVVALVLAHKKFKDEGSGFMSFGEGMGIAFWIALISVPISILFSYIYISFIDNGPFEMFMLQQEDEMIARGAPESMMKTSLEWTRKLFWGIGLLGGMFLTLLIALVVSIFTKKSSPEAPF